ncbi:tryptophan halogenase family protein [Catenovulum sediminis]|uniref:tryptophan halogenase family protein n=1 Tax=Catenovulum sediminis TaxID=1740262 RepID=UPI001180D6B5|nr:tryptophan halogenase family protein [Catenovulum sediminis]
MMMQSVSRPKLIKNIVILGGGTAGWMTAAALSKALKPDNIQIKLVESEQIGTVGVGEATIPHIRTFNSLLGISESEFMQATEATFKLGIQFKGWGNKDSDYFHPFSDFGEAYQQINFQNLYLKAKQAGLKLPFDNFSTAIAASREKKFCFAQNLPPPLLNNYSYAYHLNATAYARFLRQYSEQRGVKRVEGKVTAIKTKLPDGDICSLTLDNGKTVAGELFIDCSGFRALLIGQLLKSDYQDWSHWLKCDSAIAIQSPLHSSPHPYTQAIAHQAGWYWHIPLQTRCGNGIVYSSQYLSDQQALVQLQAKIGLSKNARINGPIRFRPGVRQRAWVKNCIAIGLSSGFLEPLESTSIHLIQASIFKLIELMPADNQFALARAEYNRLINYEYNTVRDFIILHYYLNQRKEAFWQDCQSIDIPDSLKHKIETFKLTGILTENQQGLFFKPSWQSVLFGQGLTPKQTDPRADLMTNQQALDFVLRYLDKQDETVRQMPGHDCWLNQIGVMRQ